MAKKADEYYRDERQFIDYLDDTYNTEEIWDMTDKEKKEVKEKDFKEQCKEWAKDDLTDEWNYQEIETEVELPTACPCRQ